MFKWHGGLCEFDREFDSHRGNCSGIKLDFLFDITAFAAFKTVLLSEGVGGSNGQKAGLIGIFRVTGGMTAFMLSRTIPFVLVNSDQFAALEALGITTGASMKSWVGRCNFDLISFRDSVRGPSMNDLFNNQYMFLIIAVTVK